MRRDFSGVTRWGEPTHSHARFLSRGEDRVGQSRHLDLKALSAGSGMELKVSPIELAMGSEIESMDAFVEQVSGIR